MMKRTDKTLTELVRPGPAVPVEVEMKCRDCGCTVLMKVTIEQSRRHAAVIAGPRGLFDRATTCPKCGRERHSPVEISAGGVKRNL